MPKAKRMTRKQAIALCWSKFSPEVPMSLYWEKTIGERFRWAVDAVLAAANDRPAASVQPSDGSYMRHRPSETCECHDCHIARTRGVMACPKGKGDCTKVLADKRCFGCPLNRAIAGVKTPDGGEQ